MKLRRFGIILSLMLAALVTSGAAFYIIWLKDNPEKGRILEIRDTDSDKLYGRWPLEGAGEFSIEFIHSVNQSPVRESFGIEDGMIRPLAVRFSSFGAGMQSDLEEGMSLIHDGNIMILTGFKSSFRELNYIVGTVSDHLLFINGETISLRELCGRNAHISIHLK